MASATSTLACGKEASEWDGDHKTKQCPFSTLLWSPTHTCSYDTMLQNIKNTILQSVLYSSNRRFSFLWLDGVRTSCRAVDGGMKSAKFMRRIIRICHAWKSGNNEARRSPPENLKDWLMQSSEKTKPRKTSNMMHVVRSTKVKNALLKFEWESLKTHLLCYHSV